jgi:nitrogen regulatory protein PII
MILMPGILIDKVVNALFQELKMQEPGHGILYVEPVNEVRGLIDSHSEGKDTL